MWMGRSRSAAGLIAAVVSLLVAAAPAAGSAGPVDRTFPGGALSGLAIDDGPTEGSFANLTFTYDGCGKQAGETACTWQLDVGLAPDGYELCPNELEPASTIWSGGEQTANGSVASGPQAFDLRGTPGQVLCVVLHRTSSGENDGWPFHSGGSSVLDAVTMGPELISPFEAIERRIIAASPAATPQPPPRPAQFVVGPDCKTATLGDVSYVFVYRQMGCRKATNLARMAQVSHTAPPGYRCASRAGGKRCWRQSHPKKYVEWRIPRGRPATGTS
jgi:hypothetical protein